MPLITTLWDLLFIQFNPSHCALIQSTLPEFAYDRQCQKPCWGQCGQCGQYPLLPPIHPGDFCIVEQHNQVGEALFTFSESMLTTSDLLTHVNRDVSRVRRSITLPGLRHWSVGSLALCTSVQEFYLPIYSITLETQLIVVFSSSSSAGLSDTSSLTLGLTYPEDVTCFVSKTLNFSAVLLEKSQNHIHTLPPLPLAIVLSVDLLRAALATCLASLTVNIYIHQSKHIFQ